MFVLPYEPAGRIGEREDNTLLNDGIHRLLKKLDGMASFKKNADGSVTFFNKSNDTGDQWENQTSEEVGRTNQATEDGIWEMKLSKKAEGEKRLMKMPDSRIRLLK